MFELDFSISILTYYFVFIHLLRLKKKSRQIKWVTVKMIVTLVQYNIKIIFFTKNNFDKLKSISIF